MTEPTTTFAVIARYNGDTEPATIQNVEDYEVTTEGHLIVDYNVVPLQLSRVIYASGQWASVDVRGIKRQPANPGRGPAKFHPYR